MLAGTDYLSDQARHLMGMSAFVHSVMGSTISLSGWSLEQDSFWDYFRQCLYVACIRREPVKFDMSTHRLEVTLSTPPTDESLFSMEEETSWARWMSWILAEVVNFCFEERYDTAPIEELRQKWTALSTRVNMWDANRPCTFSPIETLPSNAHDERPFPLTWYGNDWHGKFQLAKMPDLSMLKA
jgi:hypothetical protein